MVTGILLLVALISFAIITGAVLIAEWAVIATKVYEAEKEEADNDDENTIL